MPQAPTRRPLTVRRAEKAATWAIGLASAGFGALGAAKGLIPASVATALVGTLPLLRAVEGYVDGQMNKPDPGPQPKG
jgi:hypothetical protein